MHYVNQDAIDSGTAGVAVCALDSHELHAHLDLPACHHSY